MKLDMLGEFGLIDSISIPDYTPDAVILGRGDDCAVLPYNNTHYQVVSCDLLLEDVHFIRRNITPQQLGYKSVAVNLSDVAAMGGTPVNILLSLALPPDYTVEEWQGFYQGVREICRKYGINVIGGDTTSSKDRLAINVTVLGLVEKAHLHLRSHAKPGDVVFVTGKLGGSRAGLEVILQENSGNDLTNELTGQQRHHLLQCHCQPEPCCDEIAVLNRIAGEDLHALNDISDGLLSECSEIAQASNMAMVLETGKIPVDESCVILAANLGHDSLKWAMTGGEDYQLVGTMAPDRAEEICRQYEAETGKKLWIIGFAESGNGVYCMQDGVRHPVEQRGYNHFETAPSEILPESRLALESADENDGIALEEQFQWFLKNLEKREEKLRVYRHDWNNHLACLSGLLECGEYEQTADYLKQLIHEVPKPEKNCYSKRSVLNILLSQKAGQAEAAGMDVQISCEEGLLDFMSDYDLCTLLGNLLDNGLEHSELKCDAWLYLDIMQGRHGGTEIRMENSCESAPEVYNGRPVTRKEEASLHGKGLSQIQRVTEKYGGEFSWEYDKARKRFLSWCRFKNSQ